MILKTISSLIVENLSSLVKHVLEPIFNVKNKISSMVLLFCIITYKFWFLSNVKMHLSEARQELNTYRIYWVSEYTHFFVMSAIIFNELLS